MDWAKAERLAEIMYQEDEYNYAHGKPLVYFAEDDFIAEREEKNKNFQKSVDTATKV